MIFMLMAGLQTATALAAVQLPPPNNQTKLASSKLTQSTKLNSARSFQVSAMMEAGSLQKNVRTLARQYGWTQVVWDVPNDYEWVGSVAINAASFNGLLEKILVGYPLQATFYHGNHVLVISPRTLQ